MIILIENEGWTVCLITRLHRPVSTLLNMGQSQNSSNQRHHCLYIYLFKSVRLCCTSTSAADSGLRRQLLLLDWLYSNLLLSSSAGHQPNRSNIQKFFLSKMHFLLLETKYKHSQHIFRFFSSENWHFHIYGAKGRKFKNENKFISTASTLQSKVTVDALLAKIQYFIFFYTVIFHLGN